MAVWKRMPFRAGRGQRPARMSACLCSCFNLGFPCEPSGRSGLTIALLSPTSRFLVLGSSKHKTGGCGVAWRSSPSPVACGPAVTPSARSVAQQAQGGPCPRWTPGSVPLSRGPECWPRAVGSDGRTRPPSIMGRPGPHSFNRGMDTCGQH